MWKDIPFRQVIGTNFNSLTMVEQTFLSVNKINRLTDSDGIPSANV